MTEGKVKHTNAKSTELLTKVLLGDDRHGVEEKVKSLIADGANVNATVAGGDGRTLLHVAAGSSSEVTKLLLAAGADPNSASKAGASPLHNAACYENAEAATALIEAGARLNCKDRYGNTPLHDASATSDPDAKVVKVLLKAGADLTAINADGDTPMSMAMAVQNEAIVKVLAEALGKSSQLGRDSSGPGQLPITTSVQHSVTR